MHSKYRNSLLHSDTSPIAYLDFQTHNKDEVRFDAKYLMNLKLTSYNWWTWHPQMQIILLSNNFWGVIETSYDDDKHLGHGDSHIDASLVALNQLVVAILIANCHWGIKGLIVGKKSAHEAWKALEAHAETYKSTVIGKLEFTLAQISWKTGEETFSEFAERYSEALCLAERLGMDVCKRSVGNRLVGCIPLAHKCLVADCLQKCDEDLPPSCMPNFVLDSINDPDVVLKACAKLNGVFSGIKRSNYLKTSIMKQEVWMPS